MDGAGARAPVTRSVPVGVLVPSSGSKTLEATLAATLTPSLPGRATLLIDRTSPPHAARAGTPQL